MVGLLDIAPSTRHVRVGYGELGYNVPVYGVSAAGIAALLQDFPELKNIVAGGKVDLTMESVLKAAPGAIAAIIAAGTGTPGNPDAIERAGLLPAGTQAEFLDKIVELTMPDGIGPFMEALTGLINRLDLGDLGKAPASK